MLKIDWSQIISGVITGVITGIVLYSLRNGSETARVSLPRQSSVDDSLLNMVYHPDDMRYYRTKTSAYLVTVD